MHSLLIAFVLYRKRSGNFVSAYFSIYLFRSSIDLVTCLLLFTCFDFYLLIIFRLFSLQMVLIMLDSFSCSFISIQSSMVFFNPCLSFSFSLTLFFRFSLTVSYFLFSGVFFFPNVAAYFTLTFSYFTLSFSFFFFYFLTFFFFLLLFTFFFL